MTPRLPKNQIIDITSAEYAPPYAIRLRFSDGHEQTVDFEPFLRQAQHPDIRKYLDPQLFQTFAIINGRLDWNDYDLCFPLQDLYENTLMHHAPKQRKSSRKAMPPNAAAAPRHKRKGATHDYKRVD